MRDKITAAAATATVSDRRIRGPSPATVAPASSAACTSAGREPSFGTDEDADGGAILAQPLAVVALEEQDRPAAS